MPGRVILALNIVVEQTPEDSEGMSVGWFPPPVTDMQPCDTGLSRVAARLGSVLPCLAGDPESSVNMLRQQRLSKIFSHHNVMSCSLQSGQMKMKMFTDYRIQKVVRGVARDSSLRSPPSSTPFRPVALTSSVSSPQISRG